MGEVISEIVHLVEGNKKETITVVSGIAFLEKNLCFQAKLQIAVNVIVRLPLKFRKRLIMIPFRV